jgi:hypothetical protein
MKPWARFLACLVGALHTSYSCAASDATPPSTAAVAPSPQLRDHLELAAQHPSDFGFADAADARGAKLGWSYPYYSIEEWKALPRSPSGSVDTAGHSSRISEVLGSSGKIRCVYIEKRGQGDAWGPGVLGFKNLAEDLQALSRHARRGHLALLVDPATHLLQVADSDEPNHIHRLEDLR